MIGQPVVHGDDLSPSGAEAVYGAALAAGKLKYVHRTAGISTTDLIQRLLDRQGVGRLG
jgi:glycerol-3-phosphate cytidylyltransferase-like family protein